MHSVEQLNAGKLTGITHLRLSEQLTEFPMEILSLEDSLEVLDLSDNNLTELPDEIGQLHKLKIIFASNNCFETLPKALGQCEQLEMVGFKANKIKNVPEGSLPLKLRWLILTDNLIETLPNSLGERVCLQKLALAGNKITSLPDNFHQLVNLELLRISANKLASFPEQLLQLPKLAWLAFSGNTFCKVDDIDDDIPSISSTSYQLNQVLGQGASGIIHHAQWLNSNIEADHNFPGDIAIKVFKGEVTSDGYPEDELKCCLKVGRHKNVVQSLAKVVEPNYLALVMALIPEHYINLGLPPSLQTCTRDTFPENFSLPKTIIEKIIVQMQNVFDYFHLNKVSHGDLYAHNTLVDDEGDIIFGDFGAASMYHMLTDMQQQGIKAIEQRALSYFIEDMRSICQ